MTAAGVPGCCPPTAEGAIVELAAYLDRIGFEGEPIASQARYELA